MKRYRVTFEPFGKTIEIPSGQSLFDTARDAGIELNSSCGGEGTCGKCKVIVREGRSMTASFTKLSQEEIEKGYVLACQSQALSDITIEVPPESVMKKGQKIATGSKARDLERLLKTLDKEIRPRTRKFLLNLPPPNLEDNISDADRVKRELGRWGYTPQNIYCSLSVLRGLNRILREGNWRATLTAIERGNTLEVIDIEAGDTTGLRFGLAIDIGTTTIVVYLVNLIDGKIIDIASTYNSQVRFGDDVITRIVYATERGGLAVLNSLVISDVNGLIKTLTEKHRIDPYLIDSIVTSGNTTMTHLFFGVDPRYIREEPYIPTATLFPPVMAGELGIEVNPRAVIYAIQGVASYVGGDITAGVLATGLDKEEELTLFIDVGTNGEIVLGNSEWLITAACSAGPCFEGSGIRHGMRATEGAIEEISIDRKDYDVRWGVIGIGRPIGICGSGMIDALAEMFLSGVIDQKGRIREEIRSPRIRRGEDGLEYVIAWKEETAIEKDIVLTEVDINNILRAKAAIYAGFSLLLKQVGFNFNDVSKIYIAGGFGNYIDVEKAIIIGLLPDLPPERFIFFGNTSIMGAYLCLLSKKMRREAEGIAGKMTYIELSVSRRFMDEYLSALFLPHTDITAFPTVQRIMASMV